MGALLRPSSAGAKLMTGRPSFKFVLIDLPSDHEIDGGIVTECQVINAILHNRELGKETRFIRATSVENFRRNSWRPYREVGFVHLAAHGSQAGVSLIGGRLKWRDIAGTLNKIAPALPRNRERILSLSCCYSEDAFDALRPLLIGHFTGAYHFRPNKITFATAMTVWSMFYRKKTIERPLKAVVDPINDFFEREVITYRDL
jgi:hypothetical protein